MDWIWGEITEIDKYGFSWVDTITLIEIFCFHKGITVNFPILMPLKRDPVSSDIFQWYCIEISVQLVRVLFLPLRYGHCGVQSNTRYDGLDVDSKHDHHQLAHDDVIKWKHFLRYWPFVRGIHRSIPAQRPVTRSFDVFFGLRLNKRLSKQSRGWWYETPSRSLWRHCNEN